MESDKRPKISIVDIGTDNISAPLLAALTWHCIPVPHFENDIHSHLEGELLMANASYDLKPEAKKAKKKRLDDIHYVYLLNVKRCNEYIERQVREDFAKKTGELFDAELEAKLFYLRESWIAKGKQWFCTGVCKTPPFNQMPNRNPFESKAYQEREIVTHTLTQTPLLNPFLEELRFSVGPSTRAYALLRLLPFPALKDGNIVNLMIPQWQIAPMESPVYQVLPTSEERLWEAKQFVMIVIYNRQNSHYKQRGGDLKDSSAMMTSYVAA